MQPVTANPKGRIRWIWLAPFVCYTAALWVRNGPLFALLGLAVGIGLIGLGRFQRRRRDSRP